MEREQREAGVVLIIGGSGGIGSATAEEFAHAGMRVRVTYYRNEDSAARLREAFPQCEVMRCDVRSEEDVRCVVEWAAASGGIDVVVNALTNPLKLQSFETLPISAFVEDIDVMVLGSIRVLRHVVPRLQTQRSGVIVNVLTTAVAGVPPARMSSYVVAKFALLGLTQSLAVELRHSHVRVVGVSPHFVETALLDAFPRKLLELERARQPDRAFLQPLDIAAAIRAIVGDAERYPSGSNVVIRSVSEVERMRVYASANRDSRVSC